MSEIAGPEPIQKSELSVDHLDLLTEMINIGVGRAAALLSDLIECHIELYIPRIRLLDSPEEFALPSEQFSLISQAFHGKISGRAILAFPDGNSRKLAYLIAGICPEDDELDSELGNVLLEVGNIVLNGIMGSIANLLETHLDFSVPRLEMDSRLSTALWFGPGDERGDLLVADVEFSVKSHQIEGSIAVAFALGAIHTLIQTMDEISK